MYAYLHTREIVWGIFKTFWGGWERFGPKTPLNSENKFFVLFNGKDEAEFKSLLFALPLHLEAEHNMDPYRACSLFHTNHFVCQGVTSCCYDNAFCWPLQVKYLKVEGVLCWRVFHAILVWGHEWLFKLSAASFNLAKVIVVGDVAVGKTCLISRWEAVINDPINCLKKHAQDCCFFYFYFFIRV